MRVARAGSREEAERLRTATPSSIAANPYAFVRGRAWWLPKHGVEPLGPRAIFITIRRLCEEALNSHVHPHMLRHGCGYKLAADETDRAPAPRTWATGAWRTPPATPRWRPAGSRTSGKD